MNGLELRYFNYEMQTFQADTEQLPVLLDESGANANTVIMKATGAKYRIEDNFILSPT